jgi:prepilin-type N-terminal cleavage/methylation domain-containing protein
LNKGSRGFTLLEVLVAGIIVAIGIAALMSGFGALSQSQRRMIERETVERLAQTKLKELAATREYDSVTEGDFSLEGLEEYSWEVTLEESGIENVQYLRLTVTFGTTDRYATAETLVFTPPPPIEEEQEAA